MNTHLKDKLGLPAGASAEAGEVSRILVFIAVACFLVIVAVYGVTTYISYQRSKAKKQSEQPTQPIVEQSAQPQYDTKAGDIRFLFESAQDVGSVLKAPHTYDTDLTTTERFIKLTIGAQNLGPTNTQAYSWDVGDIVDSVGRHYTSINDRAYSWLPRPDLCGSVLKPQFAPTPCVKYYEVSRVSTSLKVEVKVTEPKKEKSTVEITVK